ncbi:MAG: tetratricopeptide repeat protein [Bacteroidota bacterium]
MPASLTALFFLTIFISPTIDEQMIDDFNRETNVSFGEDWKQDINRTDSAIHMARTIGYEYGEAYALYQKGYVQDEMNEAGKAFLSNLSALRLLEGRDSEKIAKLKIGLCINTGLILRQHFKYNEAIQYFNQGITIAEAYDLDNQTAELLYKIGNAYRKQGNFELAAQYLVKCHNLSVDFEDDYLPVNSLNYLGVIYHENQDYEKARGYLQQILDFEFRMIDKNRYHGIALHNIADTYLAEGQKKVAEQFYLRALEEKAVNNVDKELFVSELALFDLYMEQQHWDKAFALGEKCKTHYQNLRKAPAFYQLFSSLRKLEYARENFEQSTYYANRYESENQLFLNQQQKLIQIRDQFKMDILTASYFSELERERRISNLTDSIYFIMLFIFIGFTLWKIRQLYNKRRLERELRTAIYDLNIDDL